jgi:hypothetical protein
MNNTEIGYNCSVEDAIKILEKNEMYSFTVSQSETFSGSIEREITLEELKSSDYPSNRIITFLENTNETYSDDYDLDSTEELEFDFWEVNHDIKEKHKTKITTGEELLEYATNNLPDEIPIIMKLEYVYLDVKVGDFSEERMCFASDSYSEKNTIKSVKKSDVLKSLSSNTEYWTQKIKDSNSLQEVLGHAIKCSCDDYGKDLELSLDSYDCDFDADFKVDNEKFALGN